jgi:hypothetical protein
MDLGVDLVGKAPGAVTHPIDVPLAQGGRVQHMFTDIEITEKGAALMGDFVAAVREQVGMDIPLSADHFGHIGVNSCIRLGKALEKYNMAWLEDMIPWQYTDLLKKISDAVDIPILTGEDIYLKEPFMELCPQPRRRYYSPRSRNLGRYSRNQEDRRPGVRCPDGDAFCRHTDFLHGERALRRGDGELPRDG